MKNIVDEIGIKLYVLRKIKKDPEFYEINMKKYLEKWKESRYLEIKEDAFLEDQVMKENMFVDVRKLSAQFGERFDKVYNPPKIKTLLKRNKYRFKVPRFNQLYVNTRKNLEDRYQFARSFNS